MQKFTRRDLLGIALCLLLTAVFLTIGVRYFDAAFPEASVDFKVGRDESARIAERLLAARSVHAEGYKHAAEFTRDDDAKIFLERKLGLRAANALMRKEIKLWRWRHRWFRPLQREEFAVEIAPTGELVSFEHVVGDEAPARSVDAASARRTADAFLQQNGVAISTLRFLGVSERQLPKRKEQILTYESLVTRPAGAPYRYTVVVRGGEVASFRQALRVPEGWAREYSELRSKNNAAAIVDEVFLVLTMIAALVIFIVRLRHQAVDIRFAVGAGVVAFVLVALSTLNSWPSALAGYDTNSSFSAFVGQQILGALVGGFVSAVVLMVIVGAGEALYRERYPQHLAIPRLFNRAALRSKRVFLGFIIGFTLFAGFLAYQVLFYVIASHFGAWSPAEVPYDDILSTKLPWLAVLFMGFYPAMSEEFLSRAFSISLFERLFRSRVAAIIVAGFVWGFGHAAYPNQPFFIRGVEVGIAGVVIGLLMQRFGLLPLLVWHYTVDALYTAFVLMRSGNAYYIASSAVASLVFVIPAAVSLLLYFRRGGFESDGALENGASEIPPPPAQQAAREPRPLAPLAVRPAFRWSVALLLLAIGAASLLLRKPSPRDAVDYRISRERAITAAREHLHRIRAGALPSQVVAAPAGGFRRWVAPEGDVAPGEEEGGSPAGYDTVGAEYVLRHATMERLLDIGRRDVPAATWAVRFFTPMQRSEFRVEIDSRSGRPLGFHHIVPENAPGGKTEAGEAERIARAVFRDYGLDERLFVTKEALRFEQPSRRDWLFHFENRQPLAASATTRVHVRTAGRSITQFTRTIHIPESEQRRSTQQTFLNITFVVLMLIGSIGLLALVVSGTIAGAREHGFDWRAGLRVALWSAPLCVAANLTTLETLTYSYPTSIAWQTFLVIASVKWLVVSVGGSLAAMFLAGSILFTAFPQARLLLTSARRALARDSIARTVAAIGVALLIGSALSYAAYTLRAHWSVKAVNPSDAVAIALPALDALWSIARVVLTICAFAAATAAARTPHRLLIGALCVFLVSLDPSANPDQLAGSLITAAASALLFFALGRIAGPNPLALLTTAIVLGTAMEVLGLVGNHRLDLRVNAAIVATIAIALLAWLWSGALRAVEPET